MDRHSEIAERIRVELKMLAHVREALGVAGEVEIRPATVDQWLERFCFLGESFSRHLRRLFAIKAEGGYLSFLVNRRPTLTARAESLQLEHQTLADELDQIIATAGTQSVSTIEEVYAAHDALMDFLRRLDQHTRQEYDLWTEAFLVDLGGEGAG